MAEAQAKKGPVCLIVLGMAGAGKTSLVGRLANSPKTPYIVNLDPACLNLPYDAKIDIRDTVKYKDVMNKYRLGPNGAIVTSLNLFSTRISDVVKCIEKAPNELCILDTPGQIEVFTWSISGSIITESLAATLPTVVLYIVDCVRSTSPVTFMSNMLYACSVLYKTQLPFIIVMNKIDVVDHSYAIDWMSDSDSFEQALEHHDEGYINLLTRSMILSLDPFYKDLKICGVSAATGEGIEHLYELVEEARITFERDYRSTWAEMKRQAELERVALQNNRDEEAQLLGSLAQGGPEKSGISLRLPGDDSSSDSEGEEAPFEDTVDPEEEDNIFQKVLQQQKEMQTKRAKEAEGKKMKSEG